MAADRFFVLDPKRITNADFYTLSCSSGVLTTIAAGSASAGHLFAARFVTSGGKLFHVLRLRVHWQTIAGFTAAQELALAAFKLTGYSAAHTGGNAQTPLPQAPSYAASQLACRLSDTAALTAGTHVIGSQLLRGSFAELAAAATVQKGFVDEEALATVHPITVLGNNEGILVRNEILQGAGGTGRLTVELDGYERAA